VVVLVHGTRDSSASFRAAALLLEDLHVVLYDRRGQGRSRHLDQPTSFDDHVDDLLDVIGDRRVSVVGHSWGGHVALAAAIRRPELVRSVGVFETSLLWFDWWSRQTKEAVLAFAARGWNGADPAELAQMRGEVDMIRTAPYDLTMLRVPCVMACGADSRASEIASVVRAAEVFGAELITIDAVTHYAHRSHPISFAGFVRHVVDLQVPDDHRAAD
jgi:pimeloyl-ACP methyl ester carboxylesterase